MVRSKHQRPSRITRKQAGVTAPTHMSNAEVHKEEVTVSNTPADIVVPTAAEAPVAVSPITPAPARGTKRGRNDKEDENDEDAFYGRKSAKKFKGKELDDIEIKASVNKPKDNGDEKGLATPQKASEITSSGSVRRLKFNPEIHGVGLEARFLRLKEDMFEKLVSPRKKVSTEKTAAELGKEQDATSLRKMAKPKSVKNIPSNTPGKPVKTEISSRHQILESRHILDPQNKLVHETSASKQTIVPVPVQTSLTLEKRLQRLASPAPTINKPPSTIRNASPVRSHKSGCAFPGSPSPVKSSKPLTKPSFALSGDAHMKKRAAEREERKRRMEEVEKQKEETKKQQQLHERFKTHTGQRFTKKDQGPHMKVSTVLSTPETTVQTSCSSSTIPENPVTSATAIIPTTTKPTQPLVSRRLTLDEANQQLSNESELEEKKRVEEAVLRLRQEAAEKGKESARLWAEQMKSKSIKN